MAALLQTRTQLEFASLTVAFNVERSRRNDKSYLLHHSQDVVFVKQQSFINPITVIENHLHVNHGPTLHYRWSSHSRGEISYKIQLNVATAYNVLFHYWQHPRITLRSVFKLTVVKPRTRSHTRINQNPTHPLIPVVTHN